MSPSETDILTGGYAEFFNYIFNTHKKHLFIYYSKKAHNVRPYIIYLIIIFIRQNNAITDTDHQINAETPMFLVLQPAIASGKQ